jgi:hypothetical protein
MSLLGEKNRDNKENTIEGRYLRGYAAKHLIQQNVGSWHAGQGKRLQYGAHTAPLLGDRPIPALCTINKGVGQEQAVRMTAPAQEY